MEHGRGGIVRYGVCQALEDEANELIRKALEGVTSMTAKSDILTPWKERDRLSREVYNSTGVAEPTTRQPQAMASSSDQERTKGTLR